MPQESLLEGLTQDLIDRYDGFILDQFGVMHDGVTALPGAAEAIAKLFAEGKKLIILSNTSALASSTMNKLPSLGFDPSAFLSAVTSGQEAANHLKEHWQGKKALFLTWTVPATPSPQEFLEACGKISVTTDPEQADFVLLHGCQVLRGPGNDRDNDLEQTALGDYFETGNLEAVVDPLLRQCAKQKLPMVCVNPDYTIVKSNGTVQHMPGKIMERYQELLSQPPQLLEATAANNNGNDVVPTVVSFGKPHVPHFEACLRQLNLGDKTRVAHIGDSLHHDIAGANAAGIDSILVLGGVHWGELQTFENDGESNERTSPFERRQGIPSDQTLRALFDNHGETPTYAIRALILQ